MKLKATQESDIYTENIFGSIYTDSAGLHIDPLKPGADKLYLTLNSYTYNTEATHVDDGVVIGVPVPIVDPDVHGALYSASSDKPYAMGVSGDPNHMKLSTQNTPAQQNMSRVRCWGDSFLKVRTNFTLNQGDITSAVCNFKDPNSSLWKVKWTGVPIVDKFVCQSGKKFYSLVVDMIISCPPNTAANFYFEWDINFTTPFTSVWNFVVQSVIELITAPYINLSMVPYITTYNEHQKFLAKLCERSTRDIDNIALTETNNVTPSRVLNLYPQLPTAPPPEHKNVDDFKLKPSLLKRMFKRKKTKTVHETS